MHGAKEYHCSIPYAYIVPYAYSTYHTRMVRTVRVRYEILYRTRMVCTIRVRLYNTRTVRTMHAQNS